MAQRDADQQFHTQEKWTANNSLKWTPNSFLPNLLSKVPPLLDNTDTPRGSRKKITLERSFDKFPWMYNRRTLDKLDKDCDTIKTDKDKSKILRKLVKKAKRSQTGGHMRSTGSPSNTMNTSKGLSNLSAYNS